MLSLTRKEGQSINVYTKDGVITIRIGQHRNGQTKIGFNAPDSIQIVRSEIDSRAGETRDAVAIQKPFYRLLDQPKKWFNPKILKA